MTLLARHNLEAAPLGPLFFRSKVRRGRILIWRKVAREAKP
jgi:hypothetical protein